LIELLSAIHRQGNYEYKKGTTVILEEIVKTIQIDSVGLSAETTLPMDWHP